MGVILYLIAGLCAYAYFWVKRRYSYWSDWGYPSPPTSFPFGSLKGVGTKIAGCEAMDVYYKKYKSKAPVAGIYFFFQPTLMLLDPELIKNILVRDFASFHDRGFYYNKEDEPTSANLLTLEGAEWRERRVKLTPIFTSGKMKMMFDTVDSIGDKFVEVVSKDYKQSNTLDMRVLTAKYTADVIGNVAFGLDCKCLEDSNSEFMKHGRRLFELTPFELMRFFVSLGFPDLCRKLHVRSSPKEPVDFFLQTFLQTLAYREKNNIVRNDFVSLLLGLKEFFKPEELAAESFLVYAAGFETSSTLMNFTLFELAFNPEIQQRLRAELQSGIDENEGKLTYDLLFQFKYLDMVISESLRKYPPIPNSIRKCNKDYKIPGTDWTIENGVSIQIPVYSLHHDAEYYPEPEKFDPERFTPENVEARHPFVYLPFSEGPRNCIGMRFGLLQAKLAIVKLLLCYELLPCDKTRYPIKFKPSAPFLVPVGGMWLTLKKL